MEKYEAYLKQLRGLTVKFDDLKMSARLEERITGRWRKIEFALAGAVAVLLIGVALVSLPYLPLNGEGDPVMNYVLMD